MQSVKRVSSHGSINIPVHMRRELNLQPKDAMDVEISADGNIVIKQHNPRCVFCGNTEELAVVAGRKICKGCCRKAWSLLQEGGETDG